MRKESMSDEIIRAKPHKVPVKKHGEPQACERARGRRNPVIIIPGIGRSSTSSIALRNWLQQLEYEAYFLPLPMYGLGDMARNVKYLRRKMDEFKILLNSSHLDVVCQGEGGLILRYCVENQGQLRYLGRIIFLGTLMRGTYRLALLPLMPAPRQVMPFSSFIKISAANPPEPQTAVKYTSIYNRHGTLFIPGGSGYLYGATNVRAKWLCNNPNLTRSRRVLQLVLDVLEDRGGQGEAAPENPDRLKQLQEPEDANALIMRGKFYLERGCWELAIHDLNAAIKLKPELAEAYYLRAMAFRRKIHYDENPIHNRSIRDLSRTISLKPGFAEAYYERGVCLALLNAWSEALEDWEHALILNRDYHSAYLARGLARRKAGNNRQALEDFKEVLRLHPDNQDAIRMIAELEAGGA
jgi:tetratricopeptide (TPR) repeat protein